jgi:hypothetical protein
MDSIRRIFGYICAFIALSLTLYTFWFWKEIDKMGSGAVGLAVCIGLCLLSILLLRGNS